MSKTLPPKRRYRVLAAIATVYALVVTVLVLGLRPSVDRSTLPGDDAPPLAIAAAAHTALEKNPHGFVLVRYEYHALESFLRRVQHGDVELGEYARDASGSLRVFYIVLDEMSLLIAGLFAVATLGGLLALRAGAVSSVVGAIVMMLVSPVPIVTVGPAAVFFTAPFFLVGILLLVWRPRLEPVAAPAAAPGAAPTLSSIAGPAEYNPGREIGLGLGLLVLAGVSGVLGARAGGGAAAKLIVGAVAAGGMGIYLLVSGLVHLGKGKRE